MGRQPLAWIGLLPMIPYLICVYIAYRQPHIKSGGFTIWIMGWATFGVFVVLFAIARWRVILIEVQGHVPMDWTRFTLVSIGSCCLLIFVLSQRWSFPDGHRTLWDDLKADARRIISWIRKR